MKEHGILFSDEMIRAYRAGRKGQTRRTRGLDVINKSPDDWQFAGLGHDSKGRESFGFVHKSGHLRTVIPPYGLPGDSLWFREAWRADDFAPNDVSRTIFRADIDAETLEAGKGIIKWRPSLFLPRARCRHVAPLLSVRAERLHDISEADAKDEGADAVGTHGVYPSKHAARVMSHREGFRQLWIHLNGQESWDANPFVGVYSFEKFTP